MGNRQCSVCGGNSFDRRPVLWQALIDEWQITPAETDYVDRQQGECCTSCGANLRSIALADALRWAFRTDDTLMQFCESASSPVLKILELNEAGTLHRHLSKMPGLVFGAYPQVDMHALPYADGSFDVIVHSDTLEHIPNPIHALAECRRVLAPGGTLCFTIPVIVGRMSRDRSGLPKSYHGNAAERRDDLVVHTEFGADAWTYPMQAGFAEVHVFSVEFPAATAFAARSTGDPAGR